MTHHQRTMTDAATPVAALRGITLPAPASPVLSRAIGLLPIIKEAKPAAKPIDLTPNQRAVMEALQSLTGSGTMAAIRRLAFGITTGKDNERTANALYRLQDLRLALRKSGKGKDAIWIATATGRAWTPPPEKTLTDAEIIDAVRTLNDQPETPTYGKTAMPDDARPGHPASVSRLCDVLVSTNRTGPELAALRDRLTALVASGHLTSARIERGKRSVCFYWIRKVDQ